MKPFYHSKVVSFGLFAALLGSLSPNAARAGSTIFETDLNDSTVGAYTTAGTTLNAALISRLNEPTGIAVSGSDLFVANATTGTIGEYTTSGDGERCSDHNVRHPSASRCRDRICLSRTQRHGTIGEYTTSGATVNASLISGLHSPQGIAVVGDDLFVVNKQKHDRRIHHLGRAGEPLTGLGAEHAIRHRGFGRQYIRHERATDTVGEYPPPARR